MSCSALVAKQPSGAVLVKKDPSKSLVNTVTVIGIVAVTVLRCAALRPSPSFDSKRGGGAHTLAPIQRNERVELFEIVHLV